MAAAEKRSRRGVLGWVGPAVMVVGFLAVLGLHLILISHKSVCNQELSLMDAANQAVGSVGLRLQSNLDFLELLAVEVSLGVVNSEAGSDRASRYVRDHNELLGVMFVDAVSGIRWAKPVEQDERLRTLDFSQPAVATALKESQETKRSVWACPCEGPFETPLVLVFVPVTRDGVVSGTIVGVYGALNILESTIPAAIQSQYVISLTRGQDDVIASISRGEVVSSDLSYRMPLGRPGHGTALLITSRSRVFPWDMTLFAAICVALVFGLGWGLISLRRELGERKKIEKERELLADQLRKSQRMEALGRLAGGIAHDFNNLLTAMLGNAEILLSIMKMHHKDGPAKKAMCEHLEQIQFAGERAASLTRQLLAFSQKRVGTPRVLDANVVIGDMERMLGRLVGDDIELEVRVHPKPQLVKAELGQIEQVVMNLVVNGADATGSNGRVEVRVGPQVLIESPGEDEFGERPGKYLLITVKDDGTGIPPEVQEKMYEPFFTTKPLGKGTGLGLATVYGTVMQLRGRLEVDTKEGRGTTFSVYLPVVDEREAVDHAGEEEVNMESTKETILVCEDEPLVRRVTCEALESAGYSVIETSGGQEALDRAASHKGEIDLLLTDVMMPDMNGKELAEALLARHETLRVLYVSGYTADLIGVLGEESSRAELLEKPFQQTDLLSRVRQVLDKRRVWI